MRSLRLAASAGYADAVELCAANGERALCQRRRALRGLGDGPIERPVPDLR
jgi:hypothetical protein